MAKLDVQYVTNKPTSYFADLEFPGLGPLNGLAVLILTEADYLGGNKAYKQVLISNITFFIQSTKKFY